MLTPKMYELYKVIEGYKAKNGYMPSYQEMADMIGWTSLGSIKCTLDKMAKRGALTRVKGRSRSIRLLPLE